MRSHEEVAWDLLCSLRVESGQRWGEVATDLQRADARAVLDGSGPRRHWIGRPRGYSKTSDVAAVALSALVVQAPPSSTSFAAASDKDQAGLLRDAVAGFVARSPELTAVVDVRADRIVRRRGDASLRVLASDESGSFGLRPWLLVVDELAQWPTTRSARGFYAAISTALPKRTDSRLVIISTAGDPAHWSKKIFDGAVADADRWRVSDVHEIAPWMDPAEVEAERRGLLPSQFARLFENRWAAGEDRLVDPDDLAACMVLDGPQPVLPRTVYACGVDVGLKRDSTVISVAHAEIHPGAPDRRRVVLDRQLVLSGTRLNPVRLADVEAAVEQVWEEYRPRIFVDPWQAVGLVQRLAARRITVSEFAFTSTSVGRLAATLFTLLRDRAMALPADDVLLREELLNVRLRSNGAGVTRLDHDAGGHDDRAVSLGLAALALIDSGGGPATVGSARSRLPGREQLASAVSHREEPPHYDPVGRPGESLRAHFARARQHPGYRGPGAR